MNKIVYGSAVFIVSALFVVYAFCLNTAGAVFAESIKIGLHTSDLQVSISILCLYFIDETYGTTQ